MIFGMLMAFGVDVKNLSDTIPKVIFRIFFKKITSPRASLRINFSLCMHVGLFCIYKEQT